MIQNSSFQAILSNTKAGVPDQYNAIADNKLQTFCDSECGPGVWIIYRFFAT